MTCPDAVGNTDPRNARIDAARPVKRRKAQGPAAAAPHVIDLTGSQSEARNLHKQVDEEAVINLVNVTSPVVHLHRPNRLAAGATSSGHDAQTHSQNMPSTSSSSHKGVASSDSNTARPRPVWMQSISSAPNWPAASGALHAFTAYPNHGRAGPLSSTFSQHRSGSVHQSANQPTADTSRPVKRSTPMEPADGFIDLVKVTEDYSPALQAATARVEHASTDPALAQALAEKAELEQQLKAALSNRQACHANQPLRAPMPSHWADMPRDTPVMYKELPLPPGCSLPHDANSGQSALPPADPAVVQAMVWHGLPKADAEAALEHCDGDGDAAMLYAAECQSQGGAAACALRQSTAVSNEHLVRAAAEQARQEADLQEAQQVLARVTANNSSIQLSHVVRIERVQNPHLWTKYCLRRHEVELAAGIGEVNEQQLFHGCSKDTLATIGAEGFDIRVSGMNCSLGAGTYFAGNSSYSVGYVDKGPGMAAVPGAGMPAAWSTGAFAGIPNMPMPYPGGPGHGRAVNILPHPSRQGVAKSHRKAQAKSKQQNRNPSKPYFTPDAKAMFLCRVALGRLAVGSPGLRIPPKGFDAVTNTTGNVLQLTLQSIFAVFDNSQAYPEYVIHFRQQ